MAGNFDRVDNIVTADLSNGRADGFAPAPTANRSRSTFTARSSSCRPIPHSGSVTQVTRLPRRDRFRPIRPTASPVAYVSDESKEEEVWLYDVATDARRRSRTTRRPKTGDEVGAELGQARVLSGGTQPLSKWTSPRGSQTEWQSAGWILRDRLLGRRQLARVHKCDASENAWIVLLDLRTKREIPVASLGRQTEVGFNAQRYANEGNGPLIPTVTQVSSPARPPARQ